MFDIGFSEVFVIAIVALIVLGPERLPKAARLAGLWVRRARAQWYAVKSELENELADEELKRSLRQAQADLRQAQDQLREGGRAVGGQVEELNRSLAGSVGAMGRADAPVEDEAAASAEAASAPRVAEAPEPGPAEPYDSAYGAAQPDYRPSHPPARPDERA